MEAAKSYTLTPKVPSDLNESQKLHGLICFLPPCLGCIPLAFPTRVYRARGLDHTEVLDNVLYARLTNSTQQIKMIPKIAAIITSDEMFAKNYTPNNTTAFVIQVQYFAA